MRNPWTGWDFLACLCVRSGLGLDKATEMGSQAQFTGLQEEDEAAENWVVGHKGFR